jgi:uncharacterized membrane protein
MPLRRRAHFHADAPRVHGIVAFFFNAALLAFTVNIAASAI